LMLHASLSWSPFPRVVDLQCWSHLLSSQITRYHTLQFFLVGMCKILHIPNSSGWYHRFEEQNSSHFHKS
jgi:hypothetical protein